MRRTILVASLLAAGLLALWSTTTAQVIDGDACSDACYRAKEECITACGEHRNPMDCESECDDRFQDCLEACGEQAR